MTVSLSSQQRADLQALKVARDQANAHFNLYVKAVLAGHEGLEPNATIQTVDLDGGVIVLAPPA